MSLFVTDVGAMLGKLADGDLRSRIESEYSGAFERIKEHANQSNEKLTDVMESINAASSVVFQSAQEVSQGTDDLTQRSSEQTTSLSETASNMNVLADGVKTAAQNSDSAKNFVSSAREKAEQGGEVVTKRFRRCKRFWNRVIKSKILFR